MRDKSIPIRSPATVRNTPQFYDSPNSRVSVPKDDDEDDNEEETMPERIQRVTYDLQELSQFYNISISSTRFHRLEEFYESELKELGRLRFNQYDQEDKIDYLLLKNYLERASRKLSFDVEKDKKMLPLLPFAEKLVGLLEKRQKAEQVEGKGVADVLTSAKVLIGEMKTKILDGKIKIDKNSAYRTANTVVQLRSLLEEWYGFYEGYDPMMTWWTKAPYDTLDKALADLVPVIREKLVGIKPGDEDAIVGEPVGRENLLTDLEAEKIPYTPEELLDIAHKEYNWCETEMKAASRALGFGDTWKDALEHVKNLYVPPGQQTHLVHQLAQEAITFVKEHDLITVPRIAEETWRTFMIPPAQQKVSPFFLGGESILVSYPTDEMHHEDKMMSMRGNNVHFSRATVFHELIPGHRLQLFINARHRSYRGLFDTPFSIEGWAFYWEMILWDKPEWPKSPENKVGMLFWRMHRCARIIFSLEFHLGQMTPQECIDLLVDWVGHERATAEGEVRRSFNGDYGTLYQAGYMLGGIQMYCLRKELVEGGRIGEKTFHDRVMREGQMPIEFLRALIRKDKVSSEFKSAWRFYDERWS